MKTSSQVISTTIEEVGEQMCSPVSESRGLRRTNRVSSPSIPAASPSHHTFPLLGFYEESHSPRVFDTDDGIFAARWNRKTQRYDTEKYLDTFLQDKLAKDELDQIVRTILPNNPSRPGKILDQSACAVVSLLLVAAVATVVLHVARVLHTRAVTAAVLISCVVLATAVLCCKVKQANDFLVKWNRELQEKITKVNPGLRSSKDISVAKSSFGFFLVFHFHSEMLPEPVHVQFGFVAQHSPVSGHNDHDSILASSNPIKPCDDVRIERGTPAFLRCSSETEYLSQEPADQRGESPSRSEEP